MTCKTCQHWNMRDATKTGDTRGRNMAKLGFGNCDTQKNKWHYYPPQHTCERHKEASADVVEKRINYLGKL